MAKIRIRRPTLRDVPALARLSYDAFPSREAPIEAREELIRDHPLIQLKDRVVLEQDGALRGQVSLIPFRVWLSGARFTAGGVAGVAVSPVARRTGVAQGLMTEALRVMRARGDVLSLLYPFRHDFYRNYGYGLVGERHVFDIPPASLPLYEARGRVRPLGRDDHPRLFECYARIMETRTCWVERAPKLWGTRLKRPETRVFGVSRDGEPAGGDLAGYLIYEYRELEGRAALEVTDYAAEDESALQAILGFLASLRDQIWQLRIFAAPDEHFAQRLIEPQHAVRDPLPSLYSRAGSLAYGYMARVLDVPRALALRRYQDCRPITAALTVRDPSVEGEAVRAVLALGPEGRSEGHAPAEGADRPGRVDRDRPGRVDRDRAALAAHGAFTASPASAGSGASGGADGMLRATLDLPVDLFSQCFFGYLPWSVAFREGQARLRGDDVLPELDRAFHVPLPSMRDFF